MDLAIKKQMNTAGYIERFWDNLIKVGKDKMTRTYLTTRLELLESYWTRFLDAHDAILSFEKIDSSDYMRQDVYAVTEYNYVATKSRITSFMPTTRSADGQSAASSVLRQIQLPKISLPRFDGDQLAWEGFRDLFKSLVHDVEGLTPSQKLQYLKASLSGDAEAAVANIEISSDGYALAWDELVTRYDNRRVLLATHMRVILSAAPVTKPSSAEINRLISAVNRASRSFRAMGRPVEHWDDWFVHILVEKLDPATRLLWESHRLSRDFPNFEELKAFLLTRAHALDASNLRTPMTSSSASKQKRTGRKDDVASHAMTASDHKGTPCPLCREQHHMRSCPRFKTYSTEQRREQVRKRKACFNCLGQGHAAGACPSIHRCCHCQEKHYTLLHTEPETTPQPAAWEKTASDDSADKLSNVETSKVSALTSSISTTVLLATAVIRVFGESGRSLTVRALLDSGSEASFISERVAQQLRLPRRRVNVTVSGLQGATTGRVTHAVSMEIGTERPPTVRITLPKALVLPRLTALTPGKHIPRGEWPHLRGLMLADPAFDKPAAVDAVLGADIYGVLLDGGVKRGQPGEPAAHSTVFGWVLMGSLIGPADPLPSRVAVHHTTTQPDLHQELRRFWELEEVAAQPILTPEESRCERLFAETHTRDAEGRYIVRLPRKEHPTTALGSSRHGALRMLLSTERRLTRDPSLRERYHDFLTTYASCGHMEPAPRGEAIGKPYYLPHHAVVKASDPEGKIRVVFNASFRTTTGVSLNDVLIPGPKLQADLWLVLTRWRLHRFAFTTDIVKMFRQIRVHPHDLDLQRILWRADLAALVQNYRLTTVTYGTAPAPYLAIRTLLQLAQDEGHRFPLGAAVLRANTYVDDILAGANSMEDALELQRQTVALLAAGGFQLSKWAGTHTALCPAVGRAERLISGVDSVGALGVLWVPANDEFHLRAVPALSKVGNPTKRTILSAVAKLFDPAGWAAPVIIGAKILIQDLWMAGLDWDQTIPPPLRERWSRILAMLPDLDQLNIPRWTGTSNERLVELHGFSDASERAYAAAVYIRGVDSNGILVSNLLVAKTKVAPVKPVSMPRLELCGALLTARLLRNTSDGLGVPLSHLYAWTDAKVVLAWLRAHPSRWKPFVAHRVAALQETVPAERWHYVPTSENPADAATRGLTPIELSQLRLWWKGPGWLERPKDTWPADRGQDMELSEECRAHATATDGGEGAVNDLLLRFSSLTRLVRITAFCRRLLHRGARPRTTHLTTAELNDCRLSWLRIAQGQDFAGELEALSRNAPLPRRSHLLALRPILGRDGLIRVGGRLEHSPLAYSEKHPIVLAKGNHLALLLVRDAHLRTLHGGHQLTRSVLARTYWIIHASSLIRSEIHRCVRCARFRGETLQQQMGQLPADRVRTGRPFISAGVDYAGPIQLRASKGRGQKSFKGYICLFVCLSTKAVHLEAVSDLTTEAFLAAFRRFVARRGHCARLVSDHGTNFRSADRELRKMFRAAAEFGQECQALLATDGVEWNFIPPAAPHFGGLWEAGVKSTKHHLRRVLGDQLLTYEELSTLLCQIEACLNSRPLYPLSADPTDFAALTPGHFLIGEAPINVPEPTTLEDPPNQVQTRWRLLTNMRDHFWYRWSREYLQHLQQLGKWRDCKANLQPGTLVLLKDELRPPSKWALGRVHEVHPGVDGLVRVVSIDTATSRLTRPITKICPLPVAPDL
ncbi:uncharacterized protein LOC114940747 [Nylanderia fulva]|uniref:uncharacterized protein LOC114940747 n=1 Tax=Nylanderia fulva TaxID=613905 RepID=UPI0010FB0780|nr:uncharacterized protein LOC114940747 [Nylanderia fulva]